MNTAIAPKPIINLSGVTKSFGTTQVLKEINLDVRQGEVLVLIGASGSGKSTVLRIMSGLETADAGEVWVNEVPLHDARRAREIRGHVGMVFQQFNLFPHMTALENVTEAPVRVKGVAPATAGAAARRLLDRVGLADKLGCYPAELSGGQQQRVAIARALVQEPEIILADEPIASLDPRNTQVVMDALQHINRHFGITVICNLHSLDLARKYCDRLVGLAAGRVVFDGAPAALTDRVARDLYGLESADVLGHAARPDFVPGARPGLALAGS